MEFCGISLSLKSNEIPYIWFEHHIWFYFHKMTRSFAVGGQNHFSSPHRYLPSRAKISHLHLSTNYVTKNFSKCTYHMPILSFYFSDCVKHLFISTINSLDENKHSYALTEVLPKFRYKGISEILLKRTLPITKLSLPISEIEA